MKNKLENTITWIIMIAITIAVIIFTGGQGFFAGCNPHS
jgi:hypothetical protein